MNKIKEKIIAFLDNWLMSIILVLFIIFTWIVTDYLIIKFEESGSLNFIKWLFTISLSIMVIYTLPIRILNSKFMYPLLFTLEFFNFIMSFILPFFPVFFSILIAWEIVFLPIIIPFFILYCFGFEIKELSIYVVLTTSLIFLSVYGERIIHYIYKSKLMRIAKEGTIEFSHIFNAKLFRFFAFIVYFILVVFFEIDFLINKDTQSIYQNIIIQSFVSYVAFDRIQANYKSIKPIIRKADFKNFLIRVKNKYWEK